MLQSYVYCIRNPLERCVKIKRVFVGFCEGSQDLSTLCKHDLDAVLNTDTSPDMEKLQYRNKPRPFVPYAWIRHSASFGDETHFAGSLGSMLGCLMTCQ